MPTTIITGTTWVKVEAVEFESYEATLERFQQEWAGNHQAITKGKAMTKKIVVRTGDVAGFFDRAKHAAKRADQGEEF